MKQISRLLKIFQELLPALDNGYHHRAREHFEELGRLGARTAEFAGMVRWFTEERPGCAWDEVEGFPD